MQRQNHPSHFLRDTFYFSLGNLLGFVFGYVQGFLIPKYLSIEHYAYWRWFNLFISYLGLTHLGLPDGFLLDWVRRPKEEIERDIGIATGSMLLEQTVLLVIAVPIAFLFVQGEYYSFLAFTVLLYMVVINMSTVFIFHHQAIKKFRRLSNLLVLNKLIFVVGLLLALMTPWFSYQSVILIFCFAAIIHLVLLVKPSWRMLRENIPSVAAMVGYARQHFKSGSILLFGNLMLIIFASTDRLFITSYFSLRDFAIYSFAVTLVGIMYVLIDRKSTSLNSSH